MVAHEFPFVWFAVAFVVYTALLFWISHLTNAKASSKAPWPVVAYGMLGASVTGVTFISVPGNVWVQNFFYMPMVLGFVAGYVIIAKVLLPLYYRMGLTSIYTYLGERMGKTSEKTGSVVFFISRLLGAAVRVFVVIVVFLAFIPKSLTGENSLLAFTVVSVIFLALLYLYTYKGAVKTLIWTDVLQTTFMLLAVGLTIFYICKDMGWSLGGMFSAVGSSPFSRWFDWNWSSGTNAVKQFISGIFVTVAMTGLDQSMMQKNLACKDLKSAQKNMYTTSLIIVAANLFFLFMGALLCLYCQKLGGFEALGISRTDELFPAIASRHFGVGLGIFFLIGLISASYPSAGAALTSLTTSICVDFLGDNDNRRRKRVQAWLTLLFLVLLIALQVLSSDAVINLVYKLASYTYGPLLGIFFFGILTERKVRDKATPLVAAASPAICLAINLLGRKYLGFDLGFSLLVVNGLLSFAGLWIFSKK